ncbi:unnamed protein product [Cyprideis torosa]|uniref:Uncharacterized protein n=1 Tax=Cyprideis torosa TaxID=163714 RepID=A0A7R8WAC7_9CRUS|nr:unnamed protein product [Cyprideis torosa]CAG0886218.1 unnamed protein product [Cyprideis torosa]
MGFGFVLWILSSFKEIIRIPMQVLGIVWDRIFNFSAIDGFETGLTLGFEKETPEEETPDEETPEEETPDEETPEEMPEEQNHEEPIHGKPNAERQQSVEVQDGTDEESRKKQRETVERHQSSEKQATVDVQELKSENLQNSSENSQLRTSARDEEVKQYRETKNKVKHHNESVEKKRKKTKQPENLQEFLRKTSSLYNDLLPAQLLIELAPWEQQNAISKSSSSDINESENSAMKLMDLLTPRLVS